MKNKLFLEKFNWNNCKNIVVNNKVLSKIITLNKNRKVNTDPAKDPENTPDFNPVSKKYQPTSNAVKMLNQFFKNGLNGTNEKNNSGVKMESENRAGNLFLEYIKFITQNSEGENLPERKLIEAELKISKQKRLELNKLASENKIMTLDEKINVYKLNLELSKEEILKIAKVVTI